MNLDKDTIERADPGGMLGDVLAQPLQLGDALWRAESADIRPRDLPGGLVVCGMGGSAIGGDLALAALGDRATRPITVVRGYALESWIPPESLVLCASYSGDTEETLACFEAAGAAGTQRVVLTTGGALAELARAEGVPVIGVPAGMQPRAAVVYMTIGALECAALCGAAPALHAEIDTASGLLERLVEEWGPGAPEDSLAKRVARELDGTIPVVHGAASTVAVGRRWSTQINENAKLTRVLERAAGGEPQPDLRLGARPRRGPVLGRLPQRSRSTPEGAARDRADGRRGGAHGRSGRQARIPRREPPRASALAGPAGRHGERLHGGAGRCRPDAGGGHRALQGLTLS